MSRVFRVERSKRVFIRVSVIKKSVKKMIIETTTDWRISVPLKYSCLSTISLLPHPDGKRLSRSSVLHILSTLPTTLDIYTFEVLKRHWTNRNKTKKKTTVWHRFVLYFIFKSPSYSCKIDRCIFSTNGNRISHVFDTVHGLWYHPRYSLISTHVVS